jgi:hypothetical protein
VTPPILRPNAGQRLSRFENEDPCLLRPKIPTSRKEREKWDTHVIAKNSGHYLQLHRRDLMIEAVRNIVNVVNEAQH